MPVTVKDRLRPERMSRRCAKVSDLQISMQAITRHIAIRKNVLIFVGRSRLVRVEVVRLHEDGGDAAWPALWTICPQVTSAEERIFDVGTTTRYQPRHAMLRPQRRGLRGIFR